jgi:hypothetical protein
MIDVFVNATHDHEENERGQYNQVMRHQRVRKQDCQNDANDRVNQMLALADFTPSKVE